MAGLKGWKKRWRRLEVRMQKSAAVQAILQGLYARYVGFCYRTTRWERLGLGPYEADIARGVPRVLVTWHARLSLITYLRDWSDHGLAVVASEHADARIITADLRRRGIDMIWVSTSRERGGGVREAIRSLRQGRSLGVTVDGPLGPPRVAKPGALVIAGRTGAQVSPCSFAISRALRLKTWDGFLLPLPFGRGVLAVGEGFVPQPKATEAELAASCARLGIMIDDLTAACEARLA